MYVLYNEILQCMPFYTVPLEIGKYKKQGIINQNEWGEWNEFLLVSYSLGPKNVIMWKGSLNDCDKMK